jgi:hypothetical protein
VDPAFTRARVGTATAALLLVTAMSTATDTALFRVTVQVVDVPLARAVGEQPIADNDAETSATVSAEVEPFNDADT